MLRDRIYLPLMLYRAEKHYFYQAQERFLIKNVSSNQSVTLSSLALSNTGATGDTANYSLNSAKLNIVQRPISTVYLTKLYDASTTVQASDLQTMTNLVGSETLTLTGTSTISDANVGVKTVNTGGFTLNDQAGANASSGGLASNYILIWRNSIS